jgi:hypothetical protein
MRWMDLIAQMGGEVHAGFCLENLMERYYFGDLGMNGRVILKWMRTGFT